MSLVFSASFEKLVTYICVQSSSNPLVSADLVLAVSVASSTAPRTSLGCAWICGTFALKQTWIGLSRLGSLNACIFNLASSSTTCMWSGMAGIGPARGNGLASVTVARVLRGGKISGLITVVVWSSCGTIRFRCFRSPSSSPTCLLSGTVGIVPRSRKWLSKCDSRRHVSRRQKSKPDSHFTPPPWWHRPS